jgi:hypothetical protein
MKVLFAARMARYALLRAVNSLARRIMTWDVFCDRLLHRLMCYLHSSYGKRLVGWVGDRAEDITLHCFADADFAGCQKTARSTSGVFL